MGHVGERWVLQSEALDESSRRLQRVERRGTAQGSQVGVFVLQELASGEEGQPGHGKSFACVHV